MDQVSKENEISIPTYAIGIRILLIDSDVASLKHTTLMLEESTYQVTSAELPDTALSMIKEGSNGYDLILAAANVQGIDTLEFLKSLMILSNTPIVLISHEADFQLVATTLQQGVCHFLEKPLKRDEARTLWQFVIRKPITSTQIKAKKALYDCKQKEDITRSDKSKDFTTNGNDKGKQVGAQSHKRKKLDEGDRDDIYPRNAQKSICINNGNETNEERDNKKVHANSEKRIKWNPQLHEKFMKVLTADTQQATSIAGKGDLRMRAPPAHHLQSSYRGINNHITNSTTQISGIDLINKQRQLQMERYQINASQNSGNIFHATHAEKCHRNSSTLFSPQSQNLLLNSYILENTPNFPNFPNQYNNPQVKTTNFEGISSPYYSTLTTTMCGDSIAQGLRFDQRSDFFGLDRPGIGSHRNPTFGGVGGVIHKQHESFGSSKLILNLKGRIDQIRHEYWTKENAGTDAKDTSSELLISNQKLHVLSNPNIQNHQNQTQMNASSGAIIQEHGENNPDDDIFLDEILAELRDDFGDHNLKSLGFNNFDSVHYRR